MEKSNDTGKLIGLFLLGAAIGGAAGILFAPDKGSETRKRLISKGDDFSDAIKDKFNDFLEEEKKEAETAKDKTKESMKS